MSALIVQNLGKSFGKHTVLRDISFTLEKGEVLAIIGSSGGGKTTLLRCLNFLETADQGRIFVNDECIFDASDNIKMTEEKIKNLKESTEEQIKTLRKEADGQIAAVKARYVSETDEVRNKKILQINSMAKTRENELRADCQKQTDALRARIQKKKEAGKNAAYGTDEERIRAARLHFGLVFQQFNLFPQYTVLKNVTLAPTLLKRGTAAEIEQNARSLIARVGLSEKADFYPCMLSGGQQQRVAIARALALSPDILCFDEPTSALDPELTGEVLRVIKGLKSGDSTMVVVTHEMDFARNVADKVIFMANGIIEEMGTPAQIFDNPQSERLKSFLAKIG